MPLVATNLAVEVSGTYIQVFRDDAAKVISLQVPAGCIARMDNDQILAIFNVGFQLEKRLKEILPGWEIRR